MPDSRVAMVTGGARRLGATIARAFWEQGYDLALHYRDSSRDAERLRRQLLARREGRIALVQADLADPADCARAGAECEAAFDRLDCLVHNASVYERDRWDAFRPDALQRSLQLHIAAVVSLTQALTARLRESRGSVVLLTDAYPPGTRPHRLSYEIGKGALATSVLPALARSLAPLVRVNAVAPGAVLAPEKPAGDPPSDPGRDPPDQNRGGGGGDGRLADDPNLPERVADACLFLCQGPAAARTTGQTLRIDGGPGSWRPPAPQTPTPQADA